jgi:hypothetical protein
LGVVKDTTGSFTDGLHILGGGVIIGAICVLGFSHDHGLERARDIRCALTDGSLREGAANPPVIRADLARTGIWTRAILARWIE